MSQVPSSSSSSSSSPLSKEAARRRACGSVSYGTLTVFSNHFKVAIVQRATTDDDTSVSVAALRACTALIDNGRDDDELELQGDDIHTLARMIFDEDRTVRREAARFIRACNHLFLPENVGGGDDDDDDDDDESSGKKKRKAKGGKKTKAKSKKRSSSSSAAALTAARARERQRHRSKRQLHELGLMIAKMAMAEGGTQFPSACDARILARKVVDGFWPLASAAEGATGLVDWEAMVDLAVELGEAAGARSDGGDDSDKEGEEGEDEEGNEDEDEEDAAARRRRRKQQAAHMPRISVFLACECMRKACGMGEYDDEDGSKAVAAFRASGISSSTSASATGTSKAGLALSTVPASLGGRLCALLGAIKSADKLAVVQRSREGFSSALARGGGLGSLLSLYSTDSQCATELCEIVQIADGAVLASAATGKHRGKASKGGGGGGGGGGGATDVLQQLARLVTLHSGACMDTSAGAAAAAAAAEVAAAEAEEAEAAGVKGVTLGGTGSTGHDGSDLRYAVDRSMAYVDGALVLGEMEGDGSGEEFQQCLLAARTLPRPALLNAARAVLLPAHGLNVLGGDGGREDGIEGDALGDACAALAALAAGGGSNSAKLPGVGNKRKRKVCVVCLAAKRECRVFVSTCNSKLQTRNSQSLLEQPSPHHFPPPSTTTLAREPRCRGCCCVCRCRGVCSSAARRARDTAPAVRRAVRAGPLVANHHSDEKCW